MLGLKINEKLTRVANNNNFILSVNVRYSVYLRQQQDEINHNHICVQLCTKGIIK